MHLTKTALAALPLTLLAATAVLPTGSTASATSLSASVTTATTHPWPTTGKRQLFVSPTGSDGNPGTQARPFRQVNKAASVAAAGTIVHVRPGTYGPVTSTRNGTSRAPIIFLSDSKWRATISAPHNTSAWTNTGEWVVIEKFNITGADYNGIMTTSSNGKFLGNHIHHLAAPTCDRGGAGIVAENYSAHNNDSIGNVIHNIMAPGDCARIHGIYYQSPNAGRILNNLVYQTSGWGIHLWHNANNITISNNTVFQNKQGGMVIGGSLEGNDIAPGIVRGVVVTNNIAVYNGRYGIREMGRAGKNTYANNLVYGNSNGSYSLIGGGRPTGTIAKNPQFVNYRAAGGGDYRLRRTSPAVNRGTTLRAPRYDLMLAPRPQAGAMDIGAFEGGH
ncbi:MAG: hypothetical protein JWM02_1849 [Frankiales bacterium]|nr:hypothetical protein [Frankiales bacterium]